MTGSGLPEAASVTACLPPDAAAHRLEIRHLLFDTSDAHPSEANGVHRVARQLALEQAAMGHDTRLVVLSARGSAGWSGEFDVRTQVLPIIGSTVMGRYIRLAPEILNALVTRAGPQTVFHIHGAREPLLATVAHALARASIRYAVTVHGRYSHLSLPDRRQTHPLTRLYLNLRERPALERAHLVQAVSALEASIIRRIAPSARIKVVPNAAYSGRQGGSPAVPSQRGSRNGPVMFGYLGRYAIEHKGLDILLKGFARYRAQGGSGELELLGTGSAREEIVALANTLGLDGCARVGGGAFGGEKAAAFARWDYFVQASRYEGSPIGALEAALAGLPLLVTPGTGLLEDLVRFEAGIPIAQPTPEHAAVALAQAETAGPDRRDQLAQQAYRMAVGLGDWGEIAGRLVRLYAA